MDDRDRGRWVEQLERVTLRYEWRVFAFVLMGNHFHLFVQTPLANLSSGMHDLNGGYACFFNVRHKHEGHLYQGRYKPFLVEDQGYWLEVSRYIHLNPVRAGIVKKPENWPWSSYGGYYRSRRRLDWVNYTRVLADYGGDTASSRQRYREFIEEGLGKKLDSPFGRAVHSLVLGSDAFVERIEQWLESRHDETPSSDPPPRSARRDGYDLERILDTVAEYYGISRSTWIPGCRTGALPRAVAAHLARRLTGAPVAAIAEALGYRSLTSVSAACRRVAEAPARSTLARDVHTLLRRLRQ